MIQAAGILFRAKSDGRVLLLERDDGQGWAFPGGKLEPGETAEQAAVRECLEELGCCPEGVRTVLARRIKDGVDYTTFLQVVDRPFQPKDLDEHVAWSWVDPKKVLAELGEFRADAEFDESKHPRDEDGKFGKGEPKISASVKKGLMREVKLGDWGTIARWADPSNRAPVEWQQYAQFLMESHPDSPNKTKPETKPETSPELDIAWKSVLPSTKRHMDDLAKKKDWDELRRLSTAVASESGRSYARKVLVSKNQPLTTRQLSSTEIKSIQDQAEKIGVAIDKEFFKKADQAENVSKALSYFKADQLKGMRLLSGTSGNVYAVAKGDNIHLSKDAVSSPAPFLAAILFHENVHRSQPSSMTTNQKEREAHNLTSSWARFEAVKAKTPEERHYFNQAADEALKTGGRYVGN